MSTRNKKDIVKKIEILVRQQEWATVRTNTYFYQGQCVDFQRSPEHGGWILVLHNVTQTETRDEFKLNPIRNEANRMEIELSDITNIEKIQSIPYHWFNEDEEEIEDSDMDDGDNRMYGWYGKSNVFINYHDVKLLQQMDLYVLPKSDNEGIDLAAEAVRRGQRSGFPFAEDVARRIVKSILPSATLDKIIKRIYQTPRLQILIPLLTQLTDRKPTENAVQVGEKDQNKIYSEYSQHINELDKNRRETRWNMKQAGDDSYGYIQDMFRPGCSSYINLIPLAPQALFSTESIHPDSERS